MFHLIMVAATVLYGVAAGLLTVFVSGYGVLLVLFWRTRRYPPAAPAVNDDDLPSVTVQLPIYNEAHVVGRLIAACAQLDYPRDRLRIQVLDDSTDETRALVAQAVADWRARGVALDLLHRPTRQGYKAGALAYGLERVVTDCVAVFDADFIPPCDFLRRTLPHFAADARVGLVQARWEHLNAGTNGLTRAQVLTMDAHFAIEQVVRSRAGLPMSMNGSCGVWRAAALRDSGGWSAATLTEDLDVSYRALLRGWRFVYLRDVAVPGELPPQVQAYKLQQHRWATGMTQCLVRYALPLLRSRRYGPLAKAMGLMHLGQYAVQPLILLTFLLTPVLLWGDMFARLPNLGVLGAVGLFPPLMVIVAQIDLRDLRRARWRDVARALAYLPVQLAIGAALVLTNAAAVLGALRHPYTAREFRRTPKFSLTGRDHTWARSRYALRVDAVTVGEIGLGLYAAAGVVIALEHLPALAAYMAWYALSFWGLAAWNIGQTRRMPWRPMRRNPAVDSLSPQGTIPPT